MKKLLAIAILIAAALGAGKSANAADDITNNMAMGVGYVEQVSMLCDFKLTNDIQVTLDTVYSIAQDDDEVWLAIQFGSSKADLDISKEYMTKGRFCGAKSLNTDVYVRN